MTNEKRTFKLEELMEMLQYLPIRKLLSKTQRKKKEIIKEIGKNKDTVQF